MQCTETWEATDAAEEEYRRAVEGADIGKETEIQALKIPEMMDSLRESVRQGSPGSGDGTPEAILQGYRKPVEALMELNAVTAGRKTTGGVGKLLSSINILMEAKEHACMLRSLLTLQFHHDRAVETETLLELVRVSGGFESDMHSPGAILSESSAFMREQIFSSAQWSFVLASFNRLTEQSTRGNYGVDPDRYWREASAILDMVSSIIDEEIELIEEKNRTLQNSFQRILIRTLGLLALLFLLICLFSFIIIRGIRKPVELITRSLHEIAEGGGDLTRRIPVASKDEIGRMARSFNDFTSHLEEMIRSIQIEVAALNNTGEHLEKEMEKTLESQREVAAATSGASEEAAVQEELVLRSGENIGRILDGLEELEERIVRQATMVSQSSAAIEEMLAGIESVTASLEKTDTCIRSLVAAGIEGRERIEEVGARIREIVQGSEMLQEANELIASIAGQTNLLSMNAAIEAAHAGDAGKGFAVVAEEIRNLSETTREQSNGISKNLEMMGNTINGLVSASTTTENAFGKMETIVGEVEQLEQEVLLAMREQAAGSSQIMTALGEINSITIEVSHSATTMANSGSDTRDQLSMLRDASRTISRSMGNIDHQSSLIGKVVDKIRGLAENNNRSIASVRTLVEGFSTGEEQQAAL